MLHTFSTVNKYLLHKMINNTTSKDLLKNWLQEIYSNLRRYLQAFWIYEPRN